MSYLEKNLYTPYFRDWSKTFEILENFNHLLKIGELSGFSFNRYSGGARPRTQLRVRCKFNSDADQQRVNALLSELIEKKLIFRQDDWTPFTASEQVAMAIELSTKCAFIFNDWLKANPNIMKTFLENQNYKMSIYTRLDPLILRQLGFDAHYERYPMTESDLLSLEALSELCGEEIKDIFPNDVSITFLERFIHHFHNCIFMDNQIEMNVYLQLYKWDWMGNLITKKRIK